MPDVIPIVALDPARPTILMTGGHAGLGLVGARTLAGRLGCNLILVGRNLQRVETAAQALQTETGARIAVVHMDLSSLASVRAGAAQCNALLQAGNGTRLALSGIVCNAGAQFQGPPTYSVDGYEETFAGNCLGHFLLVNLLLDSVAESGRIVWTSSGTHDPQCMDGRIVGAAVEPDAKILAQQGRTGTPISGNRRYATSKLCTILYAYELDRRLRKAGTTMVSIAYDPGFLPDTGMGSNAPAIFRTGAAKLVLRALGMTMGQMPLSGEALGTLAADPNFAHASGKYFHSKNGALREAKSSLISYDQQKAAKLWNGSEVLVHLAATERPSRLPTTPAGVQARPDSRE